MFVLWPQFRKRAARLIRRYLAHGFDDGHPERSG